MINTLDLNKLDTVICDMDEKSIEVRITARENKYINNIIYEINNRRHSYKKAKLFNLSISESSGDIIINMRMNDDSEEGDMYHADLFI